MFRAAAPGPYDTLVAKATDENLTSEDWSAILEVCDKVGSDENGAKEAVQSIIKRLAHRNANVQLYTLELTNALSQNCGKNMHRELASRAFTDALLKLANDRNTHGQVKAKILERMKDWSDMFSKDPDLGIMYDAYFRLKQSNPQLQPPSAPQKNSLTDVDRQKEEDELQMALKLSLQEEERKKVATTSPGPSGTSQTRANDAAAAEPLKPMPSGTTAATVSRVRALYDFVPSEPGELEFKKGDVIAVLESVYKDWWRGSLHGNKGIFPLNYVEKLTDPTADELQREAQMEAEVFAEMKNVEKLLTLLSTTNAAPREEDSEEISKLYHQTLAIRPKLIKLIEKYSQKKDDFTQLNEKFIKARRDYDALMEASMSHPPQHSYQQYPMRPGQPPQGYPSGMGQAYHQSQPPPQDQQRFYTPAPQQEQAPYPSAASPNFQRPAGATQAPFYMAGAEVPAHGGPPQQHPQHPQHQQQQHQQQPPPQQQYPPRDQASQRPPQAAHTPGPEPAPIQTSSTSPHNAYNSYAPSQPPAQQGTGPQSTYGNPQELSTSVYDSPIAPQNPSRQSTYSSYSPDEPHPTSPPAQPSGPPPSAPSQPGYSTYSTYQQQPPAPQQQNQWTGHSYEGATPHPQHPPPPPQPTGQAPPVPGSQPPSVMTPPPLHPSGSAYDARQNLPSRASNSNIPSAPSAPGGGGGGGGGGGAPESQYKAYVPPPSGGGPSAPGDYYRQAGNVSY